jgi:hypothetical protein
VGERFFRVSKKPAKLRFFQRLKKEFHKVFVSFLRKKRDCKALKIKKLSRFVIDRVPAFFRNPSVPPEKQQPPRRMRRGGCVL